MQQHRRLNFSSDNFQTMQVPSYIIQTFQYINLHLLEEIHLDTLAELSHINKYYLCRSFRSYTGISIGQYIIEKRLILATKKIQAGISPSDACFQSGFNNYPNFSRTFSKRIGLSPKAYQMSVLAK
jgi:AraC-like DNA-binding protein